MRNFGLIVSAVLMLSVLSYGAQAAEQAAGLPGAYLDYAGSAQAIGMARAVTAVADGIDAVPWNPAGLGFLRPNTIGLMHTQTQEEATYENIGYAQPIYRYGGVGVNYLRLDSGSLGQTNIYNQNVGNFDDVEQTFMAGYGLNVYRNLSVGATAKFSQQSLAGASASGWGLDLGVLQNLQYGLSWGLRYQNAVAPALRYATGTDEFPSAITAGLALKLRQDRFILTVDAQRFISVAEPVQFRFGAEASFFGVAKLRAGYDVFNQEFDVGLGYQFGRQRIDYVTSSSNDGNYSQNIGYTYAFGGYPVTIHTDTKEFSPVGVKKSTTFSIQVTHEKKIYSWELQIRTQTGDLARSIRGSGNPPPTIEWDGTNEQGIELNAGNYTYVLKVTDIDGQEESTPPQDIVIRYETPLDKMEIKSL